MVRMILQTLTASAAVLLVICFSAAATPETGGIRWWSDPDTALPAAKESHKSLMFVFTADWCHFCHKLERETLGDPRVVATINRGFVPVKLDGDEYSEVLKTLGISGLPAILLLDLKSKKVTRLAGYRKSDQFLKELEVFSPAEGRLKVIVPDSSDDPPGRARVDALPPD